MPDFRYLIDNAKKGIFGAKAQNGDEPSKSPAVNNLFTKVDPAVDGDDCNHDCASCDIKYPRKFSIDETDEIYGNIKAWSTHVLVATGKTDWVRDVGDEKGSIMEAFDKTSVKPSNGKLKLSASNIPTPTHHNDYAEPTTVLILPAFTIVENVTPSSVPDLITSFINHSPTTTSSLLPNSVPISLPDPLPTASELVSRPCPHKALILLCSQRTRDARCGQSAPLLRKELERHLRPLGLFRDLDDERPGGVGIYFISHVGGHKYSANMMVYRKENPWGLDDVDRVTANGDFHVPATPAGAEIIEDSAAQCIWLARIFPQDCENIVKFTILQGKVVKPERQLRGGFDRTRGVFKSTRHHTRTKSALRSFMHKRSPSKGAPLSTTSPTDIFIATPGYDQPSAVEISAPDYFHSRALGEIQQNQQKPIEQPPSPRKSKDGERSKDKEGFRYLHKKTLSTISLKSLSSKDTENKHKEEKERKPKKSKSSTNLAALLTRPRSSKSRQKLAADAGFMSLKDKENQPPNNLRPPESPTRPPIYTQFSSQHFAIQPFGGRFLEDDTNLPTGNERYSDDHDAFFAEEGLPPTLGQRDGSRPNSMSIPASYIVQDISRPASKAGPTSFEGARTAESPTEQFYQKQPAAAVSKPEQKSPSKQDLKTKHKDGNSEPEASLDMRDVDAEFEAMLDRRNIPENQRYKMRSLANTMKIDFIRQDWAETAASQKEPPATASSMESVTSGTHTVESSPQKVKRPRSRTFTGFTLSKSSKKSAGASDAKPDTTSKHTRTKSSDSTSEKGKSLSAMSAASTLIAKAKGHHSPSDFVAYLRKVQKPESVEVGKLHKLRLLLRNETVAWTDEFITLGGMTEIISLLHRIMAVEWREEHEDALLHESLLCLKALCTTALALSHLALIQASLFPALLGMLFDEEKKGPSEFSTRTIISSLLFTYLQSAPLPEREARAEILLKHLRDPMPTEDNRPVPFVLEMHQERPYRVWCKEVVNVTKEVFWIFLHTLNVVLAPEDSPPSTAGGVEDDFAYMTANFPTPLPPLPTAPYVGGVEWEATNYITSHLFLLNGIVACLPRERRAELRGQLRISGWERCMGGSLRTCKEKFYGGVHVALREWVKAAQADGWDSSEVRFGKKSEPRSSPRKTGKKGEEAPRLGGLDLGEGGGKWEK
ncbi:hypothetical protein O988_06555, partial [Pseudogymnoascus sp. VKM F-3808]